jgi:outer membrane protein assembly factor BamB
MTKRVCFLILGAGLGAATWTPGAGAPVSSWPQWRGPSSNGSSPSAHDLPVSWSPSQNVLWRTKLPSWSAATPVVWRDTVFVTSAEEGFSPLGRGARWGAASQNEGVPDKIFLIALSRKDGSIRWRQVVDSGNRLFRKQNSASPSPITDGKNVWIMTGNGKLSCWTMSGKEVWKRDIQADYGRFGLNHGYASTPLLDGGRLYVEVLHGMHTDDPSYVFAVDKSTGKTLWRVERPTDAPHESPDNYATPQIASVGDVRQLIVSGADYVTGHDLDTGKELWRIGGFNPTGNRANRTIASSVVIGGNVFTTSTRGRPFIAFRAGGSGTITGKAELWTNNLGADVPTPTTDGRYLYVLVDNGLVNCLEAETGKAAYQGQRIELGSYSASPLLADGKIYCINEDGTTTVLRAGPTFEVLGVSRLDALTLASPVAVDRQLFIRTGEHLYCIQKQ